MIEFDHDRLSAYNLGRGAVRAVEALVRSLPRGNSDLVDQIRRASMSVVLNVAEGSGEFSPREKIRFYRIARRSASECVAVLDYLVDRGMLKEAELADARAEYARTIGALIKLIQSFERRANEADAGTGGRGKAPRTAVPLPLPRAPEPASCQLPQTHHP